MWKTSNSESYNGGNVSIVVNNPCVNRDSHIISGSSGGKGPLYEVIAKMAAKKPDREIVITRKSARCHYPNFESTTLFQNGKPGPLRTSLSSWHMHSRTN